MEETVLCDISDCIERSIMLAPSECLGAEPGTGKQKIKQMKKKIRKYITLVKTKVVQERK